MELPLATQLTRQLPEHARKRLRAWGGLLAVNGGAADGTVCMDGKVRSRATLAGGFRPARSGGAARRARRSCGGASTGTAAGGKQRRGHVFFSLLSAHRDKAHIFRWLSVTKAHQSVVGSDGPRWAQLRQRFLRRAERGMDRQLVGELHLTVEELDVEE